MLLCVNHVESFSAHLIKRYRTAVLVFKWFCYWILNIYITVVLLPQTHNNTAMKTTCLFFRIFVGRYFNEARAGSGRTRKIESAVNTNLSNPGR